MNRKRFLRLVEEATARLPSRFRKRLKNVVILVEDTPPPDYESPSDDPEEGLLMGLFEGSAATEKSVWDLDMGPDRVTLFQKNIEAVCANEEEIREEIRLTLLHELGHYFGLSEEELEDV